MTVLLSLFICLFVAWVLLFARGSAGHSEAASQMLPSGLAVNSCLIASLSFAIILRPSLLQTPIILIAFALVAGATLTAWIHQQTPEA